LFVEDAEESRGGGVLGWQLTLKDFGKKKFLFKVLANFVYCEITFK
jgi:hypothetical protein